MIDFSQLDRVIHESGRLAIMTLLAARPDWSFQDLKAELKMSDGNLSTHLRSLFKAGYTAEIKEMRGRPQTRYALSKVGRGAFAAYLDVLESIVRSGRAGG